jgi:hypothetical protein
MLDWSLPGGQDHYFKGISELAAGGGFTGEKVMEISKNFDTNFLLRTELLRQHWGLVPIQVLVHQLVEGHRSFSRRKGRKPSDGRVLHDASTVRLRARE